MLSFLKKIFGAKPAEATPVPYKIEGSEHFPFPKAAKQEKPARKPAAKKTATKTAKKEKAPK